MSKGDLTRSRIISEAATLFNRSGFEGGSMGKLMQATGLKKGGIYRHFADKEQLAAEAFDYAWRQALDKRLHGLDSVENSVDKLRHFIANFVERRPTFPGGCPLLNTAIDADDGNPVLRARARKALRGWRSFLIEIIATGTLRREIRREVDAKRLATLIISTLEGALMISRLEGDDQALRAARSYLEEHLESQVRLRRRARRRSRILRAGSSAH